MKFRLLPVALLGAIMVASVVAGSRASAAALAAKKRVLIVSHTAGFRHEEGINAGNKAIAEIGEKSGVFTVDYCRTADDVKNMLTPDGLKSYDAVIFLNTTGDLGIPDLPAFLDWIKAGHGFIGIHSATDTYHNQPAFIEMIGGEFETHGQQSEVTPKIEDPKHPAVSGYKPGFKVFDEIYHTKNFSRSRVHVLLSIDHVPDDKTADSGKPEDFPLSWCRMYGKGRVFYTAFGHRGDIYEREDYRQSLLGAIRWVTGLARGNARPDAPAPTK